MNVERLKYIWIVLSFILLGTTVVVWYEYATLKEATDELYGLQEEYRSYLSTLKHLIEDLAQQTDNDDSSDSTEVDEKKKISNTPDAGEADSFIIVDRRPAYLKQSLLNYIQEKELNIDLDEIDHIYQSYTGKTIHSLNKPKRRKTQTSRKRVQGPAVRRRKPAVVRDVIFSWPLERDRFWISSFYGRRKRANGTWGFHHGLDMAALTGTPIKAVASGRVIEAGDVRGYGNTIVILHSEKYKTRYAHLQKIKVKKGQIVKRGQYIGTVGSTGFVRKSGRDASHLHFEVHRHGKQVNPLQYLA